MHKNESFSGRSENIQGEFFPMAENLLLKDFASIKNLKSLKLLEIEWGVTSESNETTPSLSILGGQKKKWGGSLALVLRRRPTGPVGLWCGCHRWPYLPVRTARPRPCSYHIAGSRSSGWTGLLWGDQMALPCWLHGELVNDKPLCTEKPVALSQWADGAGRKAWVTLGRSHSQNSGVSGEFLSNWYHHLWSPRWLFRDGMPTLTDHVAGCQLTIYSPNLPTNKIHCSQTLCSYPSCSINSILPLFLDSVCQWILHVWENILYAK